MNISSTKTKNIIHKLYNTLSSTLPPYILWCCTPGGSLSPDHLMRSQIENKSYTDTGYDENSHLVLRDVGINSYNELVVDVESVALFQSVWGGGRSTVALRRLPDHRHVVLPDVLHVQVGWFRRLLCKVIQQCMQSSLTKTARTSNMVTSGNLSFYPCDAILASNMLCLMFVCHKPVLYLK